MKVLFCIKAMDTPGGGAERVLADVASGLADRGHQVFLLSFDDVGGESFYAMSPMIQRVRIGAGRESDSSKSFRILRHMLIMRRIIRRLAPDVAVGFMHSAYIPLGLALWGTGLPVVASEHIVPEHYRSRPLQAALLYLTPFLVNRITCVSEQVRLAFSPFLREKMVVVPNPTSASSGIPADVTGRRKQRKTILTVGRMDAQKDHRTLIGAFAKVADEYPDWDLRIVGTGELLGELKAQISSLRLDGRVLIPGATKDVGREYEEAQLYVQLSRYESYGLTVVEALGHGLPAIGFSNCLGVNELIKHGKNGLLVNGHGDQVAALADGFRTLISDTALRIELSKSGVGPMLEHRIKLVLDRWESLLVGGQGVREGATR